jgi:hypothetical protein
VLRVKPLPYYVSDATVTDVADCLRELLAAKGEARAVGERLRRAAAEGRLRGWPMADVGERGAGSGVQLYADEPVSSIVLTVSQLPSAPVVAGVVAEVRRARGRTATRRGCCGVGCYGT